MATDTWNEFANSTTASASEVNANFDAITGDLIPMDLAGSFTNDTFNLGTTSSYWNQAYINNANLNNLTPKAITMTAASTGAAETTVFANASTSSFIVTMPTAVGKAGELRHFVKVDSSFNTATVDGNASETINGNASEHLVDQYSVLSTISDGANNIILNKYIHGGEVQKQLFESAGTITVSSLSRKQKYHYGIYLSASASTTTDMLVFSGLSAVDNFGAMKLFLMEGTSALDIGDLEIRFGFRGNTADAFYVNKISGGQNGGNFDIVGALSFAMIADGANLKLQVTNTWSVGIAMRGWLDLFRT